MRRRQALKEWKAKKAREAERAELVSERDLAIRRIQDASKPAARRDEKGRRVVPLREGDSQGGAEPIDVPRVLGLEPGASEAEMRRRVRMLMRLLHPDRSINIALKGTSEGARVEAAFKVLGNLNF